MNQKGAFAIIYILAAVIAVLAVIVAANQFGVKNSKITSSPAPSAQPVTTGTFESHGCKDMDYTGCDGPEWATWTDDGKR